ncbi:response regulator [Hyphomonas sp.]|uniref:response regulator n=1 Tax=Hyphomonas sp. TaxID=87 RepID=UPI0039196653
MIAKPSATGLDAAPHDPSEDARRLRVLIVEDEHILAMELETLLEELDVEIVGFAASAAEAEALVEMARPDCMTMDVNINGERDGLYTAQQIFDRFGVRSIFISGYADPATHERAEQCQAIGWIRKPVDKSQLIEVLGRARRLGH